MKRYLHTQVRILFLLAFMVPLLITYSCEAIDELTGSAATVAKLEGDWTCDEESEIFKATSEVYTVTLSADADNASGIIIDNFYGLNASANANVTGMSLIIPNQNVEGGFSVSGSGTISSNFKEINLSYTVDDGSGTLDHATAVYTKN